MTPAHSTAFRRLPRATTGRPAVTAALAAAIIVILVASPRAQQAPAAFAATPAPGTTAASMVALDAPMDVDLLVGRSTVLNVGSPIARVSLTVPDIADAMVTAPTQLLIHGKQPGTISLFVWDRAGAIKTFEVKVRRDLTPLVAHLKQLFPTEQITVIGSGKDIVLSGTVSSKYVMEKAADVAGGYVEKKENVVNLLQQQEGVASNQVLLRVRFAEVSRSAMTELGAALFTGPGGFHDYVARSTTQQFAAPRFDPFERFSEQGPGNWGGGRDTVTATGGQMEFSDFLNLFVFNNKYNIGTVVRALQERGLFQSLAEPNLVATNGKEASFLAGGEFPIPVVQGGAQGTSVTIMFKEFGVRLSFTPTVLGGDLINLKVRPEVSALDFNNAITIEGFRVPALTSRRTETEVELRDGQTFAIAGLMNNTLQDAMRKIPGIGDIPILGWLFKSKAMQKAQTELVVMITPHIVRQGQMGVSEGLPSLVEPYLGAPQRTHPNPEPWVGAPRYPATERPRSEHTPGSPADAVAGMAPAPAAATDADAAAGLPAAPVHTTPSLPGVHLSAPAVPAPAAPVSAGEAAVEPAVRPSASMSMPPAPPVPAGPTREEIRAVERARAEERQAAARAAAEDAKAAAAARKAEAAAEKARREQEKRDAERRKADAKAAEKRGAQEARRQAELAKKEEEQRRHAAKLQEERQKREAEVAQKNAAEARRQAEDDQRRQKSLEEAALRLKAAQEAYQAELARSGGGQ
jgi:pilus assembly protein CpaC